MKKIGLLPKLFIAIAIGIVVGWVSPDWVIRVLNCFRDTFGQFIKFIVPFIILGLVAPAIIDTGRSAGRMLLMTIGIAWVSTVVFGYFAYGVSCAVFPATKTTAPRAFPTRWRSLSSLSPKTMHCGRKTISGSSWRGTTTRFTASTPSIILPKAPALYGTSPRWKLREPYRTM